jgi:hypothetical protein
MNQAVSGNGNAASFFRANGVRDLYTLVAEKYDSSAARQYKQHLKRLLATEEVADELNVTPTLPKSESGLDSLMRGVERSVADLGPAPVPPLHRSQSEPAYRSSGDVPSASFFHPVADLPLKPTLNVANISAETAPTAPEVVSIEDGDSVLKAPTFGTTKKSGLQSKRNSGAIKLTPPPVKLDSIPLALFNTDEKIEPLKQRDVPQTVSLSAVGSELGPSSRIAAAYDDGGGGSAKIIDKVQESVSRMVIEKKAVVKDEVTLVYFFSCFCRITSCWYCICR